MSKKAAAYDDLVVDVSAVMTGQVWVHAQETVYIVLTEKDDTVFCQLVDSEKGIYYLDVSRKFILDRMICVLEPQEIGT